MNKQEKEIKIRNKDHSNMMSYLRSNTHNLYAWNYHATRAADYIDKLEKKLINLPTEEEIKEIISEVSEQIRKQRQVNNIPDKLAYAIYKRQRDIK